MSIVSNFFFNFNDIFGIPPSYDKTKNNQEYDLHKGYYYTWVVGPLTVGAQELKVSIIWEQIHFIYTTI